MTTYLLDTNVFIQAHQKWYGLDFCPAFWEWLIDQNGRNRVFSIDQVHNEITRGEDRLVIWAEENREGFFLDTSYSELQSFMNDIQTWARGSGRYGEAALEEFADYDDNADPWLIAYAGIHEWIIVTHERADPERKDKVKIPDVCKEFKIDCIDPFKMLRDEGARFVLGRA